MPNRDTSEQDIAQVANLNGEGALRSYDRRKHELAQVVREGLAAASAGHRDETEREFREVSSKLASDRFNLVVVGQFSRGKSTLMNAVLGKAYLPSGIVPVTSAITAVSYGARERVILRAGDSMLTGEIPIRELANFVTEQSNPGNRRGITMAEVQAPVEILRRGFFFVDTPGLGSAVRENTATTLNFLPEADAIVFVTSCDAPLTHAELAYLRECRAQVRRLFVVVNKIDLADGAEREQILTFVGSKVREELDAPAQRVFAISARDALEAKVQSDAERLASSGLPAFEEEMIQYLTVWKQDDFLLGLCDRLDTLLTSRGLGFEESLLGRVAKIRAEIAGGTSGGGGTAEVREGFRKRGVSGGVPLLGWSCAVCNEILNAVFDFLRTYQYNLSTSEATQQAHAKAGGFCPFHTWQYEHLASPQGVASAYPQLLFRFSRELRALAEFRTEGRLSGDVADPPLPSHESCPACHVAREAEDRTLQNLAGWLSPGAARGGESRNFCLEHLHEVLLRLRDTATGNRLLLRHSENLARVAENLQRHALQFDGRRRDLMTEEEERAPRQGLTMLVGHPNAQHSRRRRIRS